MAVPSLTLVSGDKMTLRRAAREARQAYVAALSDTDRAREEARLAEVLGDHLSASRVTAGYAPMPAEISPLPALERARAGGATVAYPAFAGHQAVLRFLAGEATETGPWGVMQPPLSSTEVNPDLVLVPLVAVDRKGVRLGQGKGHYDRVLGEMRRRGALLIGVGWAVQRLDAEIEADPWDVPLDGFASPDGLEMVR